MSLSEGNDGCSSPSDKLVTFMVVLRCGAKVCEQSSQGNRI